MQLGMHQSSGEGAITVPDTSVDELLVRYYIFSVSCSETCSSLRSCGSSITGHPAEKGKTALGEGLGLGKKTTATATTTRRITYRSIVPLEMKDLNSKHPYAAVSLDSATYGSGLVTQFMILRAKFALYVGQHVW